MVAGPHPVGQAGEDPAQGRVAEPADRLRRELQVAAVAGEVALALQLAFEPPERLQVVDRLAAERAADRLLVDVLQVRARVLLAERGLQVGQVRQVGDGAGGVAEAEGLPAGHPDPRLPLAELGPPLAQRVAERGQLRRQARVLHRGGHQVRELLALLIGERLEQPLGGLHPAGERVDQLFQVLRAVREHVAVLAHELVEVLLGVLAPGVGVEHLPQVREHVLDPLHGGRVGVLERLLHALELAVEHLPAEQVAQLLELLPGGLRPPVVLGQLPDRPGGVVRQVVELGLAEPGVVARVGEQLAALGLERLVEQLAGLLEHPVEPAGVAQLALALADPPHQVVEALAVLPAAAEQVAERVPGVVAAQDALAHLVERLPDVIGRRERVRPIVVRPVPVVSHVPLLWNHASVRYDCFFLYVR